MIAIEALQEAARREAMPTTHIGRAMGKGDNYFSAVKSRGSVPRCDTMAAMADTMGYSLALVPSAALPASAIAIDPPPKP